jgi:hypothetical protein
MCDEVLARPLSDVYNSGMLKIVARRVVLTTLICIVLAAPNVCAQTVEIAPFIGYRFGGDFYELTTNRQVDTDGARSIGLIGNVRMNRDLFFEAFFTHQEAHVTIPSDLSAPSTRVRVRVNHFQAGGLREMEPGRVRPFLTGTVGLTHYEAEGDDEVRFSLSAGGGVKLYPTPHLAVRFDGRVFATIVDADGDSLFCAPGVCIGSFDVTAMWQAEFTAALVIAF